MIKLQAIVTASDLNTIDNKLDVLQRTIDSLPKFTFWETLALALIPAIIAVIATYFINRSLQKQRAYVEFITSERIRWIGDLRNNYSDLMGILYKFKLNEKDEHELLRLTTYIINILNPNEEYCKKAIKILNIIKYKWKDYINLLEKFDNIKNPKKYNIVRVEIIDYKSNYNWKLRMDILAKLENIFVILLKSEWEIVKEETQSKQILDSDRKKEYYDDAAKKNVLQDYLELQDETTRKAIEMDAYARGEIRKIFNLVKEKNFDNKINNTFLEIYREPYLKKLKAEKKEEYKSYLENNLSYSSRLYQAVEKMRKEKGLAQIDWNPENY